ncbi:molybdopterin cofactor-binding domain-containing protein [Treponema sp. HNW]|uniref:xanthine dehydrogenase family protein molybdopterin-binding subunit n=1 Tax=Treponema sp. HNW TaxID=3116654 RepID=UPI003D113591
MKTDKTSVSKIHVSSSFYSDTAKNDFLYAVLIRSPIANGSIRDIKHEGLPEGYSLFTAKDIPGEKLIRTFGSEFPVFAWDKISYEGEPIGILTGPDYYRLHRIACELNISCTQAFDSSASSKKETSRDILAERRYGYGNFDSAWKNAKIRADKTYELNLLFPSNSETDGAFCRIQGKTLNVHTASRWTAHLYQNLCAVLDREQSSIQLHKTLFSAVKTNAPWHNTVLSVQCALAAVLTKRSVLLSLSRREQMLYIERPLPVKIRHKTAINNEGTITGAFVSVSVDAGAFNPFISPLLDRLAITSLSIYKPENFTVEARAYRSYNPSGAASMQWADYHGFYAMESQIQELARSSELNSADIRLKNIFAAKKTEKNFPFRIETEPVRAVIQNVLDKSDFYRKFSSYKLNGFKSENLFSTVPLRGIGFSCGYEGSGFLGAKINSLRQSLEVCMEKDGSTRIYANASSVTVSNIWKSIAAELLSIPVASVKIENGGSSQSEATELPETLMSNISVMTQLLKKCCAAIQKLRFRQPLPIRVKRSLTPGKKSSWSQEEFKGTPFYTTSWAAAAAEIELNPKTYTYIVRNIWISIDGGTILYDSKAEFAVHQSIRRLFSCSEEFQSNPLPAIFIDFIPGNSEPKQIGELVFNVLPAAIGNAVCQALQKRIERFPLTPQAVYSCIKEREKEEESAHTAEHKS